MCDKKVAYDIFQKLNQNQLNYFVAIFGRFVNKNEINSREAFNRIDKVVKFNSESEIIKKV